MKVIRMYRRFVNQNHRSAAGVPWLMLAGHAGDLERRRDIANRLADLLAPGGLLILGQGELTGWEHPELTPVAASKVLAWQRSDPQNGNRSDHGPAR